VTVTATGTLLLVVVLLASWPDVPSPQQYATPALPSTHVWLPPALIPVTVTPDSTPDVLTATATLLSVVVLLPSSPYELWPQQYTAPAEDSAHTNAPLLLTASWVRTVVEEIADGDPTVTATGASLLVVVLLPS
jgi:hypothetical protein